MDFLTCSSEAALVDMDAELMHRFVNEGFSGGEKKRNEIFQMAMLEPKLAHPRRDRLGASTSTRSRSWPAA
jgi:hypothetical protein